MVPADSSDRTPFNRCCQGGARRGLARDIADFVCFPCAQGPYSYEASGRGRLRSSLEQTSNLSRVVERSRTLRCEADVLRARLALAVFAFLDARENARLAIKQSRKLRQSLLAKDEP